MQTSSREAEAEAEAKGRNRQEAEAVTEASKVKQGFTKPQTKPKPALSPFFWSVNYFLLGERSQH